MKLKLLSIFEEDFLWEMGYQRNVDYEIQLDDFKDLDNPSIIFCMKDEEGQYTCQLYITEEKHIYIKEKDLYSHLYTDFSLLRKDIKWSSSSFGGYNHSKIETQNWPISDLFFISKYYYRRLYPKGGKTVARLKKYDQIDNEDFGGWRLDCILENEAVEIHLKQFGYEVVKEGNQYYLLDNGRKTEIIRYLTAYYKFLRTTERDLYPDLSYGNDIMYQYKRTEYERLCDIFGDLNEQNDELEAVKDYEEDTINICVSNIYPFPSYEVLRDYVRGYVLEGRNDLYRHRHKRK